MTATVIILTWSFSCVVMAILMFCDFTKGHTYKGSEVTFQTYEGHKFCIDGEFATPGLEIVSDSFFVLRKRGAEPIFGKQEKKPLGVYGAEYYKVELPSIQKGEWFVEKGRVITVRLTEAKGYLTVKEVMGYDEKIKEARGVFLGWLLVWLIGVIIGMLVAGYQIVRVP